MPAVRNLVRDGADVALVEPGARLLGEDAGNAFAVQVGPAVGVSVQSDGEVVQARRIDLLDRVLHDGLGVLELDGREAARVVTPIGAAVAGLCDRAEKGVNRVANVGGVYVVRVREVRGADEA